MNSEATSPVSTEQMTGKSEGRKAGVQAEGASICLPSGSSQVSGLAGSHLKSMTTALQILRLGCQRARKILGWNLQKFHLTEKIKMEDSELFFQCFS